MHTWQCKGCQMGQSSGVLLKEVAHRILTNVELPSVTILDRFDYTVNSGC